MSRSKKKFYENLRMVQELNFLRGYDEEDRLCYEKYPNGLIFCKDYDDSGNVIYKKQVSPDGYWEEIWFNSDGKVKREKRKGYGGITTREYTPTGSKEHYRGDRGEEWYEFNDHAKPIYHKRIIKHTFTTERWFEYNDDQNLTCYKEIEDGKLICERHSEYNDHGKLIHLKEINQGNVYEEWSEYNDEGEILHYKDTTGKEHR